MPATTGPIVLVNNSASLILRNRVFGVCPSITAERGLRCRFGRLREEPKLDVKLVARLVDGLIAERFYKSTASNA